MRFIVKMHCGALKKMPAYDVPHLAALPNRAFVILRFFWSSRSLAYAALLKEHQTWTQNYNICSFLNQQLAGNIFPPS
jgi:hypothetical protein